MLFLKEIKQKCYTDEQKYALNFAERRHNKACFLWGKHFFQPRCSICCLYTSHVCAAVLIGPCYSTCSLLLLQSCEKRFEILWQMHSAIEEKITIIRIYKHCCIFMKLFDRLFYLLADSMDFEHGREKVRMIYSAIIFHCDRNTLNECLTPRSHVCQDRQLLRYWMQRLCMMTILIALCSAYKTRQKCAKKKTNKLSHIRVLSRYRQQRHTGIYCWQQTSCRHPSACMLRDGGPGGESRASEDSLGGYGPPSPRGMQHLPDASIQEALRALQSVSTSIRLPLEDKEGQRGRGPPFTPSLQLWQACLWLTFDPK